MKAKEWDFWWGGVTLFPYQFAVGLSIAWGWPRLFRLYFGPIKIWAFRSKRGTEGVAGEPA